MLLDYIDVDVSFIYKAQLKNWPLHRSQVSFSLRSSQMSMPELKIANMQEKHPLLMCSGAHLQSVFSIRQNNTQSPKRLSVNCQLRVGSQSTVIPASYQLSLHNTSAFTIDSAISPPCHKPQPPPLCSAEAELSRWVCEAESRVAKQQTCAGIYSGSQYMDVSAWPGAQSGRERLFAWFIHPLYAYKWPWEYSEMKFHSTLLVPNNTQSLH